MCIRDSLLILTFWRSKFSNFFKIHFYRCIPICEAIWYRYPNYSNSTSANYLYFQFSVFDFNWMLCPFAQIIQIMSVHEIIWGHVLFLWIRILDEKGKNTNRSYKTIHIWVLVFPHGTPDLLSILQPQISIKVSFSDIVAYRGEEVDECLKFFNFSNVLFVWFSFNKGNRCLY